MFKYKNKNTGAIIETKCKVSGENWVEVSTKKPSKKDEKKDPVTEDPEDEKDE